MLSRNLSFLVIKLNAKLNQYISMPFSQNSSASFLKITQDSQNPNSYRNLTFKGSNLRFKSNDTSLHPYFSHPNLQRMYAGKDNIKQFYRINTRPVFTLSFVQNTTPDLAQQAWQNRKTFIFKFREMLKIIKINPLSNASLTFIQNAQNLSGDETKSLTISDISDQKSLQFALKITKLQPKTKQQEITGRADFSMNYEDYSTFIQAIKVNMLFTSGIKFHLQLSKQQALATMSNDLKQLKKNSQLSNSKYQNNSQKSTNDKAGSQKKTTNASPKKNSYRVKRVDDQIQ